MIAKDISYNFKGFKNNHSSDVEHYFFTDNTASLYAYLVKNKDDEYLRPKTFDITSFDSAIDMITKGTCKAFY